MDIFKKIKQRAFRGYFKIGSYIHVRHWRGHGIHSPFMYGIVRNVFMKSHITSREHLLYDDLRRECIGKKNAVKLQNLFTHCKMDGYALIPSVAAYGKPGRNLCILLPDVSLETIAATAQKMAGETGCLVVLSPHRDSRRWRLTQQIWQHYPCVSVDRRLMMIYFFDQKLQPQHYRI